MRAETPAAALEEVEAELATLLADAPPIVCFANDWSGDPTSKHHVMTTLARHADVLWVEAAGMRRPNLRRADDLGRIGRRLWRAIRPANGTAVEARATPARLRVASPLSLPLPGNRAAEAINARLYGGMVRAFLRRTAPGRLPLIWVYTPTVAPYLRHIPHRAIVYHCVDRWWAFSDYDSAVMRRDHEYLCRHAGAVFASSRELLEDCRAVAPHAELVLHGVEWAHFSRAALEELAAPSELEGVEGPVLGFFGLIHEWIDLELLAAVADAFPHATLVLIGKAQVDVEPLRRRRNVRLLGQKAYDELPRYAARFDLALIPFVVNELTAAVNPIKLREYLAAGLRVVSTDLPEIRSLESGGRVRIATDPPVFCAAIDAYLREPEDRRLRAAAAMSMQSESWPGRCVAMARSCRERGVL